MSEISLKAIQYYEEHPVEFCQDLITGVDFDAWQIEAFEALYRNHFVAIKAGSGVGKTVWIVLAMLHFLATKPFSKVPCTAPSQHQLNDLIWGEAHKWISRSEYLSELLKWTQTKITVKGYDPQWFAVARTARVSPNGQVAEGLQGFHCASADSEILTKQGWKFFYQLQDDDKVLSLDPDTGIADYYRLTKIMEYDHLGGMYTVVHQNLDFCFTSKHKMLYKVRSHGKLSPWKKDEIENITYRHWYVNNTFKWKGESFQNFDIPIYTSKQKVFMPKKVDAATWFYFLGFYLAEGWCNTEYSVCLCQKDDYIIKFIKQLANLLDFSSITYPDIKDRTDVVSINSMQLNAHLRKFGTSLLNKCVPQYVKNASSDLIRHFLDGYLSGDGYINKKGTKIYYTSSKQLADDLQELIFKVSGRAFVKIYTPEENQKTPGYVNGQLVQTKHNRYRVAEYVDNQAYLMIRKEDLLEVSYNGKVYCVDVEPYHTIFTRRNGFCMWSGNSEENLLYILDEASGIPDDIFPAVEGALTGKNAYAILTSNPTRLTGYFHSIFADMRMRDMYHTMTVSCLDSKFVEERYVKMMQVRYGTTHPIYQIKVLGDFPTGSVNMLFPPEDVDAFRNQSSIDLRGARYDFEGGLDVGRTTNKSVICMRKGPVIVEYAEKFLTGGTTDTFTIISWASDYIQSYNPSAFKVDCIGIGAGVYDGLKRLYPRIVYPVIGNAAPSVEKKLRYANLRAQGYWEFRDILSTIYCKQIPIRVLESMNELQYKIANGKILVQKKSELNESPDELDATMYAFLNADLCVDLTNPIIDVFGLGTINRELEKTSQWERIGKVSDEPISGRFSQLYH